MENIIYKNEAYTIVGCCMEVPKILGKGFNEIVYKDALEIEFKLNNIPFEREKKLELTYKSFRLPRQYTADFVVYNNLCN